MNWLELVAQSEAVSAVFGATVPGLEFVRLHEVVLHRDGPTAVFRFDLDLFPVAAPVKWLKAGYNTVQIRLAMEDVVESSVSGWGRNITGSLVIQACGTGLFLTEFRSDVVKARIVSGSVRVDRVSAYCNAE